MFSQIRGLGRVSRALLFLILASVGGEVALPAQTFTWTNASTDNSISNLLNWSPGLPVPGADLNIGTSPFTAVNVDVPFAVNSVTFSGSTAYQVSGLFTLTIAGGGFIANNSTSTGIVVSAPIALASGTVTLTNAATTGGLVINGTVSGSGGLSITNNGTSTVQFNKSATFTGPTSILAGDVQVGDGTSTGVTFASSVSVASGAQLLFFPANLDSVAYNGVISGAGKMTLLGTGTLTLGGHNTYSGPTNVNSGTLVDGAAGSFSPNSAITVNSPSGQLDVNFNETIANLLNGGSGGPVAIAGGATLTINTTALNPVGYGGMISGGGSLYLDGSGSFGLAAVNNNYSGNTTINGGTLYVTNATGSATGTSVVTINSGGTLEFGAPSGSATGFVAGTITDNGLIKINYSSPQTISNGITGTGAVSKIGSAAVTLTGDNNYSGGTTVNGIVFVANTTGSALGSGTVTINSGGTVQFGASGGGAVGNVIAPIVDNGTVGFSLTTPLAFGNVISGTGGVIQGGTSTTTFTTGGNATYTGATQIGSGTLADGAAGAFSPGSIIGMNVSGTLAVNFAENIKGLQDNGGSGTVNLSNSAALTINNSASETYTGTINGSGSIIKTNTGAQTFAGNNTFDGGIAVNQGQVFITNSSGSGTGSGAITIASPATLQLGAFGGGATGSVTGGVTNNGNFNFQLSTNLTFANAISGTGAVQQLGTGTTTFSTFGTKTYSGDTVVSAGTLADSVAGAFATGSRMGVKTGGTLQVNFNETIKALSDLGTSGGTVNLNSALLNITGAVANAYGGIITGSGTLEVGAGNTTVLTGANTYTGTTLIDAGGSLRLGNGGTTGVGSVATAITDNGTLQINESNDTTITNSITGTGAVLINNSNATTIYFPNGNSYSGGTTVMKGFAYVSNTSGSAFGTGTVNGTSSTPTAFGSGGFIVGNGSFTGALTVGGGSLVFPGTFNTGASTFFAGTLSSGATTFAGTAGMLFFLHDATGVAGTGWGLLNVSGALAITATGGTPFTIALDSTDATDHGGAALNFNSATPYSWMFVHTTGGITGFSASDFTFLTTAQGGTPGLINSLNGGTFSVSQTGNDLFLNFTPSAVPEPSTWALLLAGSAVAGAAALRRRRASQRARSVT